jgi:hypothetical protein
VFSQSTGTTLPLSLLLLAVVHFKIKSVTLRSVLSEETEGICEEKDYKSNATLSDKRTNDVQ